ncbi:MAG: prepilin-type N-terminal cleavage/methylation domain-containing protein [Chromatiaceae bacterium]|nr:MAG: prepilin-type N-terminal cleavage/methylation domain-containing protein [Chromatiaceae bacterium]
MTATDGPVRTHPRSLWQRRARGVSLMELLVAMSIGAIILLGISNLFVTSKVGYQQEESLARIQESGRFRLKTGRSSG